MVMLNEVSPPSSPASVCLAASQTGVFVCLFVCSCFLAPSSSSEVNNREAYDKFHTSSAWSRRPVVNSPSYGFYWHFFLGKRDAAPKSHHNLSSSKTTLLFPSILFLVCRNTQLLRSQFENLQHCGDLFLTYLCLKLLCSTLLLNFCPGHFKSVRIFCKERKCRGGCWLRQLKPVVS